MEIAQHLFTNLSTIIILLFICIIFLEKRKKFTLPKTAIIIFSIALIWICIQFSYTPVSSARYDLRLIPIVIGSLYFEIGPILTAAAIIIRSFYGIDTGFFQTVALYIPVSILSWWLNPWFWKQSAARRVIISVCFGMAIGIISVILMAFNNTNINLFDAFIAYLVIPAFGLGIISHWIEFVLVNVEMKQQLIKAEKLKAVEQMGAAISHEIRNPLTAASGFVQLLQDDYLPRHKRKEYLAIVQEELCSAEKVIQDYLTFAKPSMEKYEELNVKKELKQIISILKPLSNQYSVEILTDFALIGTIRGDQQLFRQCFVNVLKNAIEAMPNGGTLKVATEYRQNSVTIKVKDTGIGMTPQQIQRLGEPFYSTKGKNGTGLGMMVVYSITRAMSGSIWVESEVGVGTTFYFKFPAYTFSRKVANRVGGGD
ncbi:HAMP domain-containing sensor histidine kinase [Neobacillus sp.]|jgi:two-component system, sporulation sensor kinase B|uniref:sensor histidine kinase n=1 Tax=Neobacillus sp. TaxID=2675273 RepID=UPI0004F75131|nr:histidine kinase [Bacillus sp. X1(2014)]